MSAHLTSEDGINADAILEPIIAAFNIAGDEAAKLSNEELNRVIQAVSEYAGADNPSKEIACRAVELVISQRKRNALLAHYATKIPTAFYQYDGFIEGDYAVGKDDDGHGVTVSRTIELMGGSDVRVLIPCTGHGDPTVLATLLRKIADWVERDQLNNLGGLHDGLSTVASSSEEPDDLPF